MSEAARINFGWLTRLRWGAVAAQVATMVVVGFGLEIALPWSALLGIVGVEIALAATATLWLRSGHAVDSRLVAVTLALDVVALTALLFVSGGASNPFSFLYLVYIALAAVVLPTRWTWALVALSVACSAGLFTAGGDEHAAHKHDAAAMRLHVQGMWIACAVAAGFIVHFVGRVRRALDARDAELAAERAQAARNERLASLATLAAGAAHELATPLATIAVVARELERATARGQLASTDDLTLVRGQLARCREILDQMAARSGDGPGEAAREADVSALVEMAGGDGVDRSRLHVVAPKQPAVAIVPERAVVQALRAVLRNAQDASPPNAEVGVDIAVDDTSVSVDVSDRGAGMPPEVLARVGEPFFTTKPPGRGMGLGVFLARAVIERAGGAFGIVSTPGLGTRVTLRLPRGRGAQRVTS